MEVEEQYTYLLLMLLMVLAILIDDGFDRDDITEEKTIQNEQQQQQQRSLQEDIQRNVKQLVHKRSTGRRTRSKWLGSSLPLGLLSVKKLFVSNGSMVTSFVS